VQQHIQTTLVTLRKALTTPGESESTLRRVPELLRQMERHLAVVMDEHAGMADELLRAYEQLGIVFEVTRKLPNTQSEHAVIRLFLDSLRVTYHDHRIWHVRIDSAGLHQWSGHQGPTPRDWSLASNEAVQTKRVLVRATPDAGCESSEILCAPVFSGDDPVCVIAITHNQSSHNFESGDMSLVEALMLYLGDVIRNLRLSIELRSLSMDLVRALVSAVDQKDTYTSGHSNRVGYFARLLGKELGLSDEDLQMLEWSALLHDVGKIGIRDEVLLKPGRLTPEEFEHIKEHPVRSYEVVRQIPQLKNALAGVRNHHERYDGSGYPDGLAGEAIPLQARIVLVADIFDSLTTTRTYRKAFHWEKALEILNEEAGTVGDPVLVELFDRIIRREMARGLVIGNAKPQDAPQRKNAAGSITTGVVQS